MKIYLFHLLSFDQRVPKNISDQAVSDDNLFPLLDYLFLQPIAVGCVFTAFSSLHPAIETTKGKLEYIEKGKASAKDWMNMIKALKKTYFKDVLLEKGSELFPSPLARSVKRLRYESHYGNKLMACRDIFENGLRLISSAMFMVSIATDDIKESGKGILGELRDSEMENRDWGTSFNKLLDLFSKHKSIQQLDFFLNEIERFLFKGSGDFSMSISALHRLRNELAHDKLKTEQFYTDLYNEFLPDIQCVLEGLFLFAVHPFFDNIDSRIFPGRPYRYSLADLRGDHIVNPRIDLLSGVQLSDSKLQWCFMENEKTISQSFSLSPLLFTKVNYDNDNSELYIVKNIKRGEYHELTTGKIYKDRIMINKINNILR